MSRLDPRVQLAWLLALLLAALLGGVVGLAASAALALVAILATGNLAGWLRTLRPLLPLATLVVVFDTLGGDLALGLQAGARLLVLAAVAYAFGHVANGEALIAGLRALRVPFPVVFVLVASGRFVPTATADLADLRDAARLRGVVLDGPPWRQLAGWQRLLVPLLVGTIRRGLQLGEAMEARAFGASPHRTVRYRLTWRQTDFLGLLLAVGYLVGVLGLAAAGLRL